MTQGVTGKDPVWDLPNVQLQVSEAAYTYGEIKAQSHLERLRTMDWTPKVESPIEAIFWIWWLTLEACTYERAFPFKLVPQFTVHCDGNEYRLDFAIPEHMIAVELDGHEFHEKTKEQVTYRNQRDRNLQAAGWTVFHFSGSELYRGQIDTVAAVADLARQRADPGRYKRDP